MTDHSLLYSIQNDILVGIKKILHNLKHEKPCNKTQNYFENHENDLETLWKEFRTNHNKLESEGENKKDLYFKSGMFAATEVAYKTTREKLNQMHQYYKLANFPAGQGSSRKHEPQGIIGKREIEDICMDQDDLGVDTAMNPVKLLENSDVATINDSAVLNIEESSNGVEFISVEFLLNELSAQTTSKIKEMNEQQKSTKTIGDIDLSFLDMFDEQPNKKIQCPVKDCMTRLSDKDRMIRHLRIHNGEMPYQCNHCDYATYNSTRIEEHINTHSGIKPYKCRFCKYSSVSKKYLKKHETKHCKCECGFESKSQKKLTTHKEESCPIENEKTPNKYSCKYCDESFSTRLSSRSHRQARGLCSICNDFVCGLSGHMMENHGVSLELKMPEENKVTHYKFVCKVCGWSGAREQKILLHLIHHPQEVSKDIDVTILKKYNIL